MSKSLLLMMCVLVALLVLACAPPVETNRNAVAPSNTITPVPTGEQIGIAECDNFITAYENCVSSKTPEAGRAQLRASITTWRTEWKKLADNPQTRGTLAAACKAKRDAIAPQMKVHGCTF